MPPSLFQGYTGQKPKPPVTPKPPPDPNLSQQALQIQRRSALNQTVLAGDLTRKTTTPSQYPQGGLGGGKTLLGV